MPDPGDDGLWEQFDAMEPSIADVIQIKLGTRTVWKVLVTLVNGNCYLSDQHWDTVEECKTALLDHLEELGIESDQIEMEEPKKRLH